MLQQGQRWQEVGMGGPSDPTAARSVCAGTDLSSQPPALGTGWQRAGGQGQGRSSHPIPACGLCCSHSNWGQGWEEPGAHTDVHSPSLQAGYMAPVFLASF